MNLKVRSVWNKKYDPHTMDEEESRRKLLMGLSLCGYDIKTQAFSKDPVNLGTGNFIYDRVDLEIRGKGSFQFKRFYNSQSKTRGVLGQGWTHSFEEKLLQDQGEWKYIHGDGAEEPFYKKQDGTLQSALTTGNILYVDKDIDVIHKKNSAKIIYWHDELGRHIATTDEAGTIHYMYNKHNVKSSSTDRRGNTTKYLYDNKGNLISVRDAMGNVAYYDYDTKGHLTAIFRADDKTGVKQKTTYLYDLMGLPSVVTDALGYEEYYQYNLNEKLIRKTDLPSKNREGDCQRRADSIPMAMIL